MADHRAYHARDLNFIMHSMQDNRSKSLSEVYDKVKKMCEIMGDNDDLPSFFNPEVPL